MAKAKVAEYKKKYVKDYVNLLNEYPIAGVLNMANFPASQLVKMREKLRDSVVIRMGKKRLYKIALAEAEKNKKDITKLADTFENIQPALLFTKDNPFVLFKRLKKEKSKAFAKGGNIAPEEITIKAGPTSFAPGPIISELGKIGLKTAVENGKITIKEDKIVAKPGDAITGELASLLMRLDIKPMEIGLDLVAAYEDGFIFDKNIMSVDEEEYINNITLGATWANNLSIEAGIVNKGNAEMFILKAFNDSKALALSENILADAVLEQVISKAEAQMNSLKSQLNLPDVVETKEEEKKEEPKPKEEPPKEKEKKEEEKPTEPAPKEEAKEEEKPAEEPKPEPVPEPEAPKEEPKEEKPKEEEKPTEEPVPEPKEEPKPEPSPEPETPKEEEPKQEPSKEEEKPSEPEPKAEETKPEPAPEEPKPEPKKAKDEVPTIDELYSQVKKRSKPLPPEPAPAAEDEINNKINDLVKEVKEREEKKEEGDTENIINDLNNQKL